MNNSVNAQDSVSFNRDIRPILSNNCYQCHGFDANTREADLRLDTREGATSTELESIDGFAIVPGEPENSVILQRIMSHDSLEQMPPPKMGKRVNEKEIAILKKWIEQGAHYEQHWAFIAPKAEPEPSIETASWPRNSIDHFILARLEKENLLPSVEAERRTLIRRVSLDVTGLPPTLKEIETFLADDSELAYEKMVDRFLDSPSYGEHMSRHWLDLARYADTSGYQYDKERTMWVWRDWVINAYNKNMPFDQFTIEQLAGDLLPNATTQQILATGFNRNHPITIEGGVIDEEYRTEYVIDRLSTTSTVWMGLTVACARCHDHKFDPISQKDFYQLSAFFNQVAERGFNGFDPQQRIASPLAPPPSEELLARIKSLQTKIEKRLEPDPVFFEQWTKSLAQSPPSNWTTISPQALESSGGSTLTRLDDLSILASGKNPPKDNYTIKAVTEQTGVTAIRLECLTHDSLPGGGPGRHMNSNFVLSEMDVTAVSLADPKQRQSVKFSRAFADYSQSNYGIEKAIDGVVKNNNGWAVDGPSRKQSATAIFVAETPLGFDEGTELIFSLRHQANFGAHGIGRVRLAITGDNPDSLQIDGVSRQAKIAAAKELEARSDDESALLQELFQAEKAAQTTRLKNQLTQLSPINQFPMTMVMKDLAKPRKTHILTRGQYDLKADEVAANVPQALIPLADDHPRNRLGLARWLTDPRHPLTARVAVNRHWARIFGTGIVKTVEDFGTQGEWPSHPGLLDSLAIEFVDSGWDVKQLLRKILTSSTYRQSSKISPEQMELDPENRFLGRASRFRLDAEQIRDQALAISGLLNQKVGGPSVYPYQPDGLWMELNNRPGFSRAYVADHGESLYRRSMYTFWKRTVLSPMMKTFDAPGREFCTVNRSRSNTPLQALLLLQGTQFVEAARQLAQRMMLEGGAQTNSRIEFGFETATARKPTAKELAILNDFYEDRLAAYSQDIVSGEALLNVGESPRDLNLPPNQHAAWTEVARLILNLDEVINRD